MHIPSEPSLERVHSGGIDYAVHVFGEGPPVLLLHGFPETHWSFAHNWDAIAAAGHRVIAIDLKGYGHSDKPLPMSPHGDYRISRLADEIGALIQALGYEQVDVVGHDWGGVILSAMMLRCRPRIRRAILINAPFRRFVPWRPRHIYFFNLPKLPERRFWKNPTRFVWNIINHWTHRQDVFTDEDVRRYVRAFQQENGIACALAYYRGLRKDLPFLGRAQLPLQGPEGGFPPTLILWGARDPIMPPAVARMAHADLSESELVFIPDAGHFAHREAPEAANAAIIDFLGQP
jgi:pimeloyl-ACP methyl ester carboxylesterase